MKRQIFSSCLSILLCIVLITATALFAWGCENKEKAPAENAEQADVIEIGNGAHSFTFNVKDSDGILTSFSVHSDEKTVGDALKKLKLIDGDETDFGLYVKEVNGITADYDKNGCYWAFYIGEEMAMSAVDAVEIEDGATYAFAIEK